MFGHIGAKRFVIPADGDYGDLSDEEPEDFDEDETISVQYMVSKHEEADHIELECFGNESLPIEVAEKVSEAITKLVAWSKSKGGRKEIDRVRDRLLEDDLKR